ncbi:MAG: DUF357 domain-containing protein [Candidatus Aenigmatarchaeota archaeon]|nr:MAG: DUF357 domain-containing protein [Candidatus Aenigmarchaeota archaeon]
METKEALKTETEKWLSKIEEKNIIAKTEKGEEFKKNIEAYISDSKHFTEKGDCVRAFEAIIWAWAFLEISEDLKLLET